MKIRIYWRDGGFADMEVDRLGALDDVINVTQSIARIDQIGDDGLPLPGFLPPACQHPPDKAITERRMNGRHYCGECGADLPRLGSRNEYLAGMAGALYGSGGLHDKPERYPRGWHPDDEKRG